MGNLQKSLEADYNRQDRENFVNHDLSETICPECGYKNPARNSSDEIQCENCGYDEANE